MFNINDYVVYKRSVCKIKDIIDHNNTNYYVLVPIDDDSLMINVPVENCLIRNIISIDEAEKLIDRIPSIEVLNIENDKLLEQEYKRLLYSSEYDDLIKIIKTTYLRNENRVMNKRKIGEKDDAFFKKAEKLLYNELSLAYNMSYDDLKEYIIKKTNNNMNK